ncbi:MAG: folylpolyglutamate synthase/dihydrofolate synthase family protein [Candidatus Omnitrophota bacterium]|jgi:dihydrofolate synthase/folylpolyglutamate synthase|nr:bifunctional folylpolyglutamate synthase/dihydrofolate synthase [Candidatus Omnitrophota bacterium]
MTYLQAIQYLESFINYEKVSSYRYKKLLGLKRIKGFLKFLGNPQKGIRFIHVAGTKGKGSTCVFIAYILKASGFKVGLYTSPHLADFRERIRIMPGKEKDEFEGMISRLELKRLLKKLKPFIEEYNRSSLYGKLTFFEVYTALAIAYFREKKVDFAVLETGLGGRLDATNAVSALISVITPISYEHTDKLGKALGKIAFEKAGIIKGRESAVISAPQEKEAMEVIRKRCMDLGVRFLNLNKYQKLKIKLYGGHQLINANVAKAAVLALRKCGINIADSCIKKGLSSAVWPARCEVLGKQPQIIIDGAQNASSAEAIKCAVRERFRYRQLILVLGVSKDKDIKGVCSQLYSLADKVILTKADSPRGIDPKILAKFFKNKESYIVPKVSEAKVLSMRLAGKSDLILVTGSLFVAGEYKYGRRKFN